MAAHEHSGVYGAWLQDGRLVTVEKARGPYTGWLDLPGGTPEPGESEVETLRRELFEECGVEVDAVRAWSSFDVTLDRASDGSTIDFRHRGRIALVDVRRAVRPVQGVEDVARVVLLDDDSTTAVTPSVRLARQLLAAPVCFRIPDDVVADGDLPVPAPGVVLHGVGLRIRNGSSSDRGHVAFDGEVVWARTDDLAETRVRGPVFDVLTQASRAAAVPEEGSRVTITGSLDSIRPHEFADFDLPDVRRSWFVRSLVSRDPDGYVVDAVPLTGDDALPLR